MDNLLTHGDPIASMKAFKAARLQVQLEASGFKQAFDGNTLPWVNETQAHRSRWSPYSFEGGAVAAIAGADFCVLAGDTRLSAEPSPIMTRQADKITQLNPWACLCMSGFEGDVLQMKRVLKMRLAKYKFDFQAEMPVDLLGEMLARNLYYRRFFPYLTGSILGGIDENGKGAVFSYDPVGCLERVPYNVEGSAGPIIEPFFDAQIGHCTTDSTVIPKQDITLERAVSIIKDAFRVAAEREITTGDSLKVVTMRKIEGEDSVKCEVSLVKLRED